MVSCPGPGLIRSRARCRQGGHWVDCYRDSCCPGYTLIVGRCIPDTEVLTFILRNIFIWTYFSQKFNAISAKASVAKLVARERKGLSRYITV